MKQDISIFILCSSEIRNNFVEMVTYSLRLCYFYLYKDKVINFNKELSSNVYIYIIESQIHMLIYIYIDCEIWIK